ncbi:hypothetical protein [Solirubrum puertoriconensis]|nr:hypothetical protein [Solirubrum puertoriconensis]
MSQQALPPPPSGTSEYTFTEQQSFLCHWWWLILLLGALTVGLTVLLKPLPLGARTALLFVAGPLTLGLLACFRLQVRLNTEGIRYRFFPLGWRLIGWAEVQQAYVRKYSALREYGGWGIKGFSLNNYAYNVAGSYGLQLVLRSGTRILLGTQRPAELQQALERLGAPAEVPA